MISFDKNSDAIQILAPASRAHGNQSLPLIEQGIKMLQDCGFNAYASSSIISKEPHLFYAASLEERFADFLQALTNPQVKILWALRGGYGSCEVANMLLDFKITSPKILIGFSDITSMHILFNQFFKLPSIHANNITSCLKYPDSLQPILNMLDGKILPLDLTPLNDAAIDHLAITGVITGGNLKVLTTLIGTPLAADLNDKILILEDVNEPGYAVMRDLMHLKYGGLLCGLKAIIFGDFRLEESPAPKTNKDSGQDQSLLWQVLHSFSQNLQIPAFATLGFGHGPVNLPVLLGSKAKIMHNSLISL